MSRGCWKIGLAGTILSHSDNFLIISLIVFQGQKTSFPRWKESIISTGLIRINLEPTDLVPVVTSLYIRKYFNDLTKEEVEKVVNNIMDTNKHMVKNYKWMDQDTKNEAVEKLRKMKISIGYPDEVLDQQEMNEFSLA